MRWFAVVFACGLALPLVAGAQPAGGQPAAGGAPAPPGAAPLGAADRQPRPGAGPGSGDPYQAYASGLYDEALRGFLDQQVERPDDPEVLVNVGNAHYKLRQWQAAEEAFAAAAGSADPAVRQQALYSLGNAAFRNGRLTEAVDRYKAALELDPDDLDSKFNLEFVRRELGRRQEEEDKQQQQPRPDQQGGGEEPEAGGEGQDRRQQAEESRREDQGQQQGGGQEASAGGEDSDQDGLPDEVERSGDNPTDPANPDSDGDGLADGQEDADANGRVDPGETDPNDPDSDGDGLADGREPAPQQSRQGAEAGAGSADAEGMTPEEAERYLQALTEARPRLPHLPPEGRRTRPEKDW